MKRSQTRQQASRRSRRDRRLLAAAVLGVALAAGGCGKDKPSAGNARSEKAFYSAVPFGPGEIVQEKVDLGGEMVKIAHSKFDVGPTGNLFDNDPKTLVRTERANPAVIEMEFPAPRAMKGLSVTTASMEFGLTARVTSATNAKEKVYSKEFRSLPPEPTVQLDFDSGGGPVRRLRLEITRLGGSDGHIHIREIHFN